jgi:hypothetical protein
MHFENRRIAVFKNGFQFGALAFKDCGVLAAGGRHGLRCLIVTIFIAIEIESIPRQVLTAVLARARCMRPWGLSESRHHFTTKRSSEIQGLEATV